MRNPIGLPAELVAALKLLPTIAARLGEVVDALRTLPDILVSVDGIRADTTAIRPVTAQLGAVAKATEVLPQMDARMTSIEAAMPVLLEVQQHLANLPDTIERLDARIEQMAETMQGLLTSLTALDKDINTLSASVEPLGRLADRMPGGNSKR